MALVLRKAVLPKNVSLLKCIKGRSLATAASKKNPAPLSTNTTKKWCLEPVAGIFRSAPSIGLREIIEPFVEKREPHVLAFRSVSCLDMWNDADHRAAVSPICLGKARSEVFLPKHNAVTSLIESCLTPLAAANHKKEGFDYDMTKSSVILKKLAKSYIPYGSHGSSFLSSVCGVMDPTANLKCISFESPASLILKSTSAMSPLSLTCGPCCCGPYWPCKPLGPCGPYGPYCGCRCYPCFPCGGCCSGPCRSCGACRCCGPFRCWGPYGCWSPYGCCGWCWRCGAWCGPWRRCSCWRCGCRLFPCGCGPCGYRPCGCGCPRCETGCGPIGCCCGVAPLGSINEWNFNSSPFPPPPLPPNFYFTFVCSEQKNSVHPSSTQDPQKNIRFPPTLRLKSPLSRSASTPGGDNFHVTKTITSHFTPSMACYCALSRTAWALSRKTEDEEFRFVPDEVSPKPVPSPNSRSNGRMPFARRFPLDKKVVC